MASASLSSILSKTSQLLSFVQRLMVSPSSSSDPRNSVLNDVKKLERTYKRIQAVLHDAEEGEIREEAVKLRLKELKEVAYEVEDVLDEYHYEELRVEAEGQASRKRKRVEGDDEEEVSGSLVPVVVSIPDGMGDRIREIKESFDEILEDMELLRLREEDGERPVFGPTYPAPTSHMVDESRIYGREHDKQEIIDLLISEGMGNGISVIPIVGKGGLGKTAIAQLVYNDSKIEKYFHLTGWVCVSDDFDVTRLTKAIIESLTESSCDLTQLSTLQNTLKKKVKGKRVLLVLDDIWNEQQSLWESLRIPLVGAETVRIIMTCRNDSVAEIMQTVPSYYPDYLSEDESWLLFKHYAFGGPDYEEQSGLADIGKQIVKKCSGLPLAMKTIGSLLRHTTSEEDWMEVLQSDIWEPDEKNETLAALRLSYNRMPAHLKPCFIYCSMFPKGYPFETDVLVRLWMAQGFIPFGGRRRMEEIGHEYFNDLQRRSFFDSYYFGFKMHDMIHDLAKSIAENGCCAIMDKKPPSFPDQVRHLYVQGDEELVKSCSQNNWPLRTLILGDRCRDVKVNQEVTQFPLLLPWTRHLRALEFYWKSKDELPDSIGDHLKHLRYLHIRSQYIWRLPKSVCLLYHLQILIIDCGHTFSGGHLAELPDGLGTLTNLRYFKLWAGRIKRLPESVCLLHHLQTLILECGTIAELPDGLDNLTNLLHFKLRSNVIERLPGSICQLRNLQMLDIRSCRNLVELPKGIGRLANLHLLDTSCTGIRCLPVGIKKLTNLQSLRGRFNVRGGREQGGIGVLKDLVNQQEALLISGLSNLVNIEDARDAGLKCKHKLEELYLDWYDVCPLYDGKPLVHLHACPEENKDVSADEKQYEAMLENLQPHANLKKLFIKQYDGSKFPKWVGNPFFFASLQEIYIIGCKRIGSLPLYIRDAFGKLDAVRQKEPPQSVLERVNIEHCRQLTSIVGLHNLHLLKELKIIHCPRLRFLSEEGLPSKLETLHIEQCQQLESLSGMQNVASLRELIIQDCPKLQIMAEDQLSSMPHYVDIVDCPGLLNWCLIQKINCIQVASGNKLTISNTWGKIMHGFDDFPHSMNHFESHPKTLFFSNSWNFHWERYPMLKELTIWSCMHIPPVGCLPKLTSLRSLVIKDCPRIQLLPDDMLPSTLTSLVFDNCENLRSLHLGKQKSMALKELQIVNCPNLTMVEGLNFLCSLNFLRIKQCLQVQLSRYDWLLFYIISYIEIEGALEIDYQRFFREDRLAVESNDSLQIDRTAPPPTVLQELPQLNQLLELKNRLLEQRSRLLEQQKAAQAARRIMIITSKIRI